MEEGLEELAASPSSPTTFDDETSKSSRMFRYERQATVLESIQRRSTEEDRRLLLEKDISDAHEKGFWVCRLWRFVLVLNITLTLTTTALIFLLLFIIGPLSPYQTYGHSCRALSCNSAQGLVCNTASVCVCPSTNSYWSRNETGCRRCPYGWSLINGKCLFVSTFTLNWTDAFAYCKSFTAQLLTLSTAKLHSDLTLSHITNLVASNTNYFIGLSEQPNDSGHWQWVDGSPLLPSSSSLFCTNGSLNQFDPIFRTNKNCVMYRMDSCFARSTCQRVDIHFLCQKI